MHLQVMPVGNNGKSGGGRPIRATRQLISNRLLLRSVAGEKLGQPLPLMVAAGLFGDFQIMRKDQSSALTRLGANLG